MYLAKTKCLIDHEREEDEPIFALERDEEYFPKLKSCVKETLLAAYAKKKASGQKEVYSLNEDALDQNVGNGLDWVKLVELKDHDIRLYEKFRLEI